MDKLREEFICEMPIDEKSVRRSTDSDMSKKIGQLHTLTIEEPELEHDIYFVKHVLAPYLSNVYQGLILRQGKEYLSIARTKQYLALPELLGKRVVRQMNANGDERIDHDEFVGFFLSLLMGTVQQKMYTAYRCFDGDDDECISEEEVRLLLATVPLNCDAHEPGVIPDADMTRQVYDRKRRDEAQI